MSAEVTDDKVEEIKQALFGGRKIEAIKLYCESTGKGLKEAKEAVEKLEQELRQAAPEKFTAPESQGCLGLMVGLALLGGMMVGGWVAWA